jgi:hypothetical protein
MEQDSLPDKLEWQQKVRDVDASLHAAFAAQKRTASRKKAPLKVLPDKVLDGLKPHAPDKPLLPSSY